MRILFCSNLPLTKELGAPKVLLELAEALEEIGWQCVLHTASDLEAEHPGASRTGPAYARALRAYLQRHADQYDVVDYEHAFLPYPRRDFDARPLFVARTALLVHHLQTYAVPVQQSARSHLGRLLRGRKRRVQLHQVVRDATITMSEADLINVNNDDAKTELIRHGFAPQKIVVVPLGLSRERQHLFDAVSSALPERPIVAFVGTFDPRKGAVEFPDIVRRVILEVPQARFRLLGTRGMYPTAETLLQCFPRALLPSLEVVPQFDSNDLPSLLADCSLGIFPSHLEGFGLGVLEMLAASLPVIAYDAPGPPMMLPPQYLVPRGNARQLADKVIALLRDPEALAQARVWAKARSRDFTWENAARLTQAAYAQHYAQRLKRHVAESSRR